MVRLVQTPLECAQTQVLVPVLGHGIVTEDVGLTDLFELVVCSHKISVNQIR